jgi:hypothetical protein
MRIFFTIEGSFPVQPADGLYNFFLRIDGLYKLSMYIRVWRPVTRRKDREAVEMTVSKIHAFYTAVRDPGE